MATLGTFPLYHMDEVHSKITKYSVVLIKRLSLRDKARMFYVYNSGTRERVYTDLRVIFIGPKRPSEMVLETGLFDWLMGRAG